MKFNRIAILLAATALSATPALALTISNAPTGSSIGTFGASGSTTYGQVFTAPTTGTLTSFTLNLNGGVGAMFGGVGTWNGTAAYGTGFGSPTNLYQSADIAAPQAGAYTVLTDAQVTAGERYVAYLSVFGVAGAEGAVTMPLGNATDAIHYFVWNNETDPRGNAAWNYFADFGAAQFSATITPGGGAAVPEPATWGLMVLGFGLTGAAMRTRRRVAVAA